MSLNVTTCVGCGQADNHPKDHVLVGGHWGSWHHDCGAVVDPPASQACVWLAKHKGDLKGDRWCEQIASLHTEIPADQLHLQAHEWDVVESHRDGARPNAN
jgi:hypothetical protein